MRLIYFIAFTLFFLSIHSSTAQQFLVVETKGKIKTKKISIGTDIRIHLREDKKYLWHNYNMVGLDEKNKCIIVSDNYCIQLKDINGLDLTPGQPNAMAKAAAKFTLPYMLFSAVQIAKGTPMNNFQIGLGSAGVLGWIVAKLFLSGQVKIGSKRRLRIIDLTLEKPKA